MKIDIDLLTGLGPSKTRYRIANAFKELNITDWEQLETMSREEIMNVRNLGKKSLADIEQMAKERKIIFRLSTCPKCHQALPS